MDQRRGIFSRPCKSLGCLFVCFNTVSKVDEQFLERVGDGPFENSWEQIGVV